MLAAVTGASGHLGANLVRALISREWKVRALVYQDTRALEKLNIERISGDVLNNESLVQVFKGVDIVIHLAGRISVVNWDHKEVEAVDIRGVQNVVNACMVTNVKRLIHVSSFHAHKQEPLDIPLDESRPLIDADSNPAYNHSKAEGERIIQAAIKKGFDAVIINPTGILGPHDYKPSHFGATLIEIARGKLPALVNAGLDWVDNRDVADGIISACELAKAGAKYFLSGHWVTLADMAQQVTGITGAKLPRVVLPMWLAKASAPPATLFDRVRGKRPLFTPISMKELDSNPDISHEKATKELGYEPRPIQETITDTINWFQDNGYLDPVHKK